MNFEALGLFLEKQYKFLTKITLIPGGYIINFSAPRDNHYFLAFSTLSFLPFIVEFLSPSITLLPLPFSISI